MALKNNPQLGRLIHHSDRGSQYCSHQYRQIIQKHGFAGSMSRKGNCYDNAPIESFWGQLKNELVYHKIYETRQQAIADVRRYIEIFYNRQRIQKGLGFKSPAGVSKTFTIRLPDEFYQVFYSVVDSRGQTHPTSATKVQAVLVRDPSMPYGFIVLTAYPKP